ATPRPEKSAASASSMTISVSLHGSVWPAERDEAKKRTISYSASRSARIERITSPTMPVAPTIPMRAPLEGAISVEPRRGTRASAQRSCRGLHIRRRAVESGRSGPGTPEPADPRARRFSGATLRCQERTCKPSRTRSPLFAQNSSDVAPAYERASERHLVRVLEVAAHGESARKPRGANSSAQLLGEVPGRRLSGHVRVGR